MGKSQYFHPLSASTPLIWGKSRNLKFQRKVGATNLMFYPTQKSFLEHMYVTDE